VKHFYISIFVSYFYIFLVGKANYWVSLKPYLARAWSFAIGSYRKVRLFTKSEPPQYAPAWIHFFYFDVDARARARKITRTKKRFIIWSTPLIKDHISS